METKVHQSDPILDKNKPGLIHWANLLYAVIFIGSILIAIQPAVTSNNQTPAGLDPAALAILSQIALILAPTLIFILLTRQPLQSTLKLKRLRFGTAIKCAMVGLLCWPLFVTLGNLGMILLSMINPQPATATNIVASGGSPWMTLMMLVIVAPLFEELLFRGAVLGTYERQMGSNAIGWAAILFAFFHFSPDNFLGPLLVGLVAGWLVYRTRSIWSGVLVHLMVNLLSGLLLLLSTLAVPIEMAEESVQASAMSASMMWQGVILWGGISLILLVPVLFLMRSIGKKYPAPIPMAVHVNLKSIWSTLIVSVGAIIYFCYRLISLN